MSANNSEARSRRPLLIVIIGGLLIVIAVVVILVLRGGPDSPEEAVQQEPAVDLPTSTPSVSATPEVLCPGDRVTAGLETITIALQAGEVAQAQAELDAVLAAYAGLIDRPECAALAQDLLGVQTLVSASVVWDAALESGSVKGVAEAARLARLADALIGSEHSSDLQALAAGLLSLVEQRQAALAELTDPGRTIVEPATLETETAGGLHPLCEVNTVIKTLLTDQSGDPILAARRMAIYSDTLFLLAGGQLMAADLERVHGASPAVFFTRSSPEGELLAGSPVEELVDLTRAANGDLLLLEKSGRVLRRSPEGAWSVERPAQPGEMPVAIAPYGSRFYLLDPASNQIWRYPAETDVVLPNYFGEGVVRNMVPGVDMAIDGAIYVARYDGLLRRYYVGVEDPDFSPDTGLGSPTAIFLPDAPESTLVYLVDGPGRRVLGLERETGSYRLGFSVNVAGVGALTSAAIYQGRLYLTDGETLFITILSPTAMPAVDCPAIPFEPLSPLDRPDLMEMGLVPPVSASLPEQPAYYPGGRWPELGLGVLDGLAFASVPYSDSVRAIAPGTILRIVDDPPPLLEADLGVITSTGQVPLELNDAVWGRQVWIDHGNGVQTRYGGMAAILPTLEEGQAVRMLTILGFAGEGPVYLGIWVDDHYLGYGHLVPETIVAYRALFEVEE